MLIAPREGDRRCKLRPSQRAVVALLYLHERTTCAKLAAGFRISRDTAHAYVRSVIELLAPKAPSVTRALRDARRTPSWTAPSSSMIESATMNGTARANRRHGVKSRPSPTPRAI
ncbi:helix-turn-helix domain-containing protein [Streptomyces sp. 1222.5]|uniref:helix-turn-helix domain-containing protein n=1 Tax=Streptomyces sp. 1222.5 TaxID=1881026 RepID=UPI003EB9331C